MTYRVRPVLIKLATRLSDRKRFPLAWASYHEHKQYVSDRSEDRESKLAAVQAANFAARAAARSQLALLSFLFFCILTVAGEPDAGLLSQNATINIPFAGIEASLSGFLLASPLVLLALAAYHHFYLGFLRGFSKVNFLYKEPVLPSLPLRSARITSALISYLAPPLGLAAIAYKALPRKEGPWLVALAALTAFAMASLAIRRNVVYGRTLRHLPRIVMVLSAASLMLASFSIANRDDSHPILSRRLSLFHSDLSDSLLSGLNMPNGDLRFADFRKSDLSRANLRGADLSGANLAGAVMRRSNLSFADLTRTDLSETDIRSSTLVRASFFETDLRASDLRYATMSCTKLHEAILSGVKLDDADLRRASFVRADLHGASLKRANLVGSEFHFTDMNSTVFDGADLSNAKLTAGSLMHASLVRADLRNVQLMGMKLHDANMTGANLSSAVILGSSLTGVSLRNAVCFNADFSETDLLDTDLTGADLRFAGLGSAQNLTQDQLDSATGDRNTGIPTGLVRPCHWENVSCSLGATHEDPGTDPAIPSSPASTPRPTAPSPQA